jgi:Butirosin biosynthesis protein H, N-terminal
MSARRELKPGPANPRTLRPQPFVGVHCETVATGTLLRATGCELSEPMLFGLGEALGFVFLNLASLPLPFLGEAAASVAPKAKILTAARDGFARSSGHWTAIAELLARCARDGQVQHLVAASELCRAIAEEEVAAMTILARV